MNREISGAVATEESSGCPAEGERERERFGLERLIGPLMENRDKR